MKNLELLTVNTSTILKGTIKYPNGNPVPADSIALIDISYGIDDEYQAFAINVNSSHADESTGSFYNESTGEFQLLNCLKGGNHNYALHINHLDLDIYSSWDNLVTINEGVENNVEVIIVKN